MKTSLMKTNELLIYSLIFSISITVSKAQFKSNKAEVLSKGYGESYNIAYSDAMNQAFFDLIAQYGDGINIGSTRLNISKSSSDYTSRRSYSSMILGLDGLVSDFIVLESSHILQASGRMFEVTIRASATVYSENESKVKSHKIFVNGVEPQYKVGQKLKFDIICEKQMYVYVYELANDNVSILYPNVYLEKPDPLFVIESKELTSFPPGEIEFPAALNDTVNEQEHLSLVLLASNMPINIASELTIGELVTQYSLLPSKKDIKIIKVAIVK